MPKSAMAVSFAGGVLLGLGILCLSQRGLVLIPFVRFNFKGREDASKETETHG